MLNRELLACLSCFDSSVTYADFFEPQYAKTVHPDDYDSALELLDRCRELGASLTFPGDGNYPPEFENIDRPPRFLSFFGAPVWRKLPSLAVVGSREPHVRTLEWLDLHFTKLLRAREFVTVSGAARGVDQRAHLLSVRCGRPTLAFLPSGLGQIYPAQFRELTKCILDSGGAVISEYMPNQTMRKHHFLQRNRLIAGLARVVFVAEASRRSGSMMTGRLAQLGQSRLCVLPSFPGDGAGSGTLELLIEGATPLRDGEDLLSVCDLELSNGKMNFSGHSLPLSSLCASEVTTIESPEDSRNSAPASSTIHAPKGAALSSPPGAARSEAIISKSGAKPRPRQY